jgi:hypothetical protein
MSFPRLEVVQLVEGLAYLLKKLLELQELLELEQPQQEQLVLEQQQVLAQVLEQLFVLVSQLVLELVQMQPHPTSLVFYRKQ